jgi:hypothetical protein
MWRKELSATEPGKLDYERTSGHACAAIFDKSTARGHRAAGCQ